MFHYICGFLCIVIRVGQPNRIALRWQMNFVETTSTERVSSSRNRLNFVDFTEKPKTKNKEERESKHETNMEEREDVSS